MMRLGFFSLLCVCLITPAETRADLITFDDLGGGPSPIQNGYGGLNWQDFYAFNPQSVFGNSPNGYANGVVSPQNVAYDAGGYPASFSSDSTLTFSSVYLTAAWANGLNIEVQGYVGGMGGTLVDDTNLTVNSTGPTLFTFNWSDIDTVNFIPSGGTSAGYPDSPGGGTHFAMDNLNVTPTPEPSSIALAAFALATGAAVRRLRQRKTCQSKK